MASSRSIYQINEINVFPQGDFDSSNEWEIESQFGFSELNAKNTDAIIADGKLSLTHQRAQNVNEMLFWATDSTSGHESAEGTPDGLVAISSGADIDLTGFDFSSINNFPLVSASLVVSFRISNGLNDDRVEFSISSDAGVFMIDSYSSTFSQGEINHLSSPYMTYNLDGFYDWDWDSISSSSVKLNYESVGGSDEAHLEIDAVAINIVYQMPESGFDLIKAETNLELIEDYEYDNLILNLSGAISGNLGQINQDLSWIKLQIGSEVVFEQKINSNLEIIEISLGLNPQLFMSNEILLFAIGVQIYWDSNGSSSDAVIMIEEITLEGVTFTEWDEDPICLPIEDVIGNNSFLEDSGQYKIIPLRDTCTDDRTNKDSLTFTVNTNPEGVVEALIDDGHLKIFGIQDSSGISEISVSVFDSSGNSWNDTFFVEVLEINDEPMILNYPDEVWIEFGSELNINGTIYDVESDTKDLNFSSNNEIAVINSDNTITLTPFELGLVEVTLTLSDGNSIVSHKIIINTYSESDLNPFWIKIESKDGIVDLENNKFKSSWDSEVIISAKIDNLGNNDATFVSVRCYLNDELVGNLTIAQISSKSNYLVELPADLTGSEGDYLLKLVVDSHDTIQESDESNNEIILSFSIINDLNENGIVSESELNGILPPIGILLGFILLGLALIFGPKKVQRIK
ncbi:MAG: CARDB domain-containing protein [Candidatus Thermoplasmatota archaeon]|nr:CARDB domain-containing protein [Candidatus Thermoplasmatota archaeon]